MKPPGSKVLAVFLFLYMCAGLNSQILAGNPVIRSDQSLSTAGYFRLTWQASGEAGKDGGKTAFVVQQSHSPEFAVASTLYEGAGNASLVSGLANGMYYFRVKTHDDEHWSKPVRVEVHHHSLKTALQFFVLGLLVFALTLFTILRGVRQTRS